MLAYGDSEVGVDVEKILNGRERIVNNILKDDEREYIYSVVGIERCKRFTQIWTLKESYIKYLGTGLSTAMNTFSVIALNNIEIGNIAELNKHIFLKSVLYKPDYYMSICGEKKKVTIKEISLEDLIKVICIKKNT